MLQDELDEHVYHTFAKDIPKIDADLMSIQCRPMEGLGQTLSLITASLCGFQSGCLTDVVSFLCGENCLQFLRATAYML